MGERDKKLDDDKKVHDVLDKRDVGMDKNDL